MKHLITSSAILLMVANMSFAQVAINADGSAADPSAMLDIKSTTKGLLVPRLTSAQRLAISNAADGLFIYDSVVKQLFYYQAGYGWQQMLNSNGAFSLPYYGSVNNTYTAFTVANTGTGDALEADQFGLGTGAHFENWSATNTYNVLEAQSDGYGNAGNFTINNANSGGSALYASTTGMGNAANFVVNNASDTSNALSVTTNAGLSNAGYFFNSNTNGRGAAVYANTVGSGSAVYANTVGLGTCLEVQNQNATSLSPVIDAEGSNMGPAGFFGLTNPANSSNVLFLGTLGTGPVLVCNQGGPSGDLATFELNGFAMARISHTGEGFFDGGIKNSGADLAEAVDVEGNFSEYEPGDVLEISASSDRTVVKSSSAYSTLVVGVYATKPGVLLTEDSINSTATGKVPMGVVGIIPTKVCNENGPIVRGDLLVTSSRPGYAMKADLNKVKIGQVLGKAMQSFDGKTGKIKVLVNVR